MNTELIDKVLDFLYVRRTEPSLDFLNELVKSHQEKVKWENLTKIIDWESGERTGDFLPPFEEYFDRVIHKGMGGTCWTLARGLYWLLSNLGFSTNYLYMDSGHLCLRVDVDIPYYVDIGYCAPLFKAYSLFDSFQVENEREVFKYLVDKETIRVERNPGPIKTLNPNPVKLSDVQPIIKHSNDWQTSPVLKDVQIFGYIEGVPTSLKNNQIKQHFKTGKIESRLNDKEIEYWVTERFGVDKALYHKALSVYKKMT